MTIEVKELIFPSFINFKRCTGESTNIFGYAAYFKDVVIDKFDASKGYKRVFDINIKNEFKRYDCTPEEYERAKEDIRQDRMKKLLAMAAGI